MAIWQFDLAFVPCAGPMPWRTVDGCHDVPAVQSQRIAQARTWLLGKFGEPWEMLEDWLVYGSETGNRIDLLLNQDGSAEVTARIDARSSAIKFIRELCEFSELLDCELFSAEFWKMLNPTPSVIDLALERSRAAKYVRDPENVLKGKS